MKSLAKITLVITLFFSIQLNAQEHDHRNCGTQLKLAQMIQEDSTYVQVLQQMEAQVDEYAKTSHNEKAVITIPVVVHVIYKIAAQNISDAQIQSQIDALNKDYRRLNTDVSNTPSVWSGIAADCQIEFCLAKTDPSGNPTTGITRTQTTKTGFDIYTDEAKFASSGGHDIWNRNYYLNLWVVPAILEGTTASGILGYAQMPGSTATTDGVVICYRYFGTTGTAQSPFNKGRTATHEIGHWLNLYHIWGDDNGACNGSDNVTDTPNQAEENYGSSNTFPLLDACATTSPGVMFMNYMDYTDDGAMNLFTNGQKTRMLAALNNARAMIKTSPKCQSVGFSETNLITNLTLAPNPANDNITLTFENNQQSSEISYEILNSQAQLVAKQNIGNETFFKQNIDISDFSKGIYFLKLQAGTKVEIKTFIKL